MILIVGGMAQGKRQLAEALLSEGRLSERLDESRPVRWADGGQVSLEEFAAAPFGCHAQLLIRRLLERDPSLTTDPQWTSIAAEEQLGTALSLAIPGQLLGLFTDDPDTVAHGARALRIIALGFLVSGVSVTASGALEGLGKGSSSLVISLCRYTVIILPAAWLLSRFLGPDGVWHAFWITELLSAAAALLIYRRATPFCRAAK